MKKLDIIIIISIFIISFVSLYYINKVNKNTDETIAEIYVDKELYKSIALTPGKSEILEIDTELGYNIIEINNGKIRVKDADCPDKTCVKDGFISKPGEIIVCLPHKIVIEIKGEDKLSVDGYSY